MRITLKDGTGVMDLNFITEDVDRHGNVRLYVRKRKGKKIRLRAPVGTPEFLVEYREALPRLETASPAAERIDRGSLKWLTVQYQLSGAWQKLEASTQRVRRRILDEINQTKGGLPIAGLKPRHLRAIRDEKVDMPHAADNRLKALSAMFTWASEADLMDANPCREVKRNRAPSDGHHTWSVDEIRQYQITHPAHTKAGLAGAILFYTAARVSDACKLGPQHETEGGTCIRFAERKGKKRHAKVTELPIHPELRKVLDLHPTKALAYLITEYGRPFSEKGLSNKVSAWCKEAGLPHCSAHGLRKAAATIAADNQATDFDLMGMMGWTSPKEGATYTRKVNRKRLAAVAVGKLNLGQK